MRIHEHRAVLLHRDVAKDLLVGGDERVVVLPHIAPVLQLRSGVGGGLHRRGALHKFWVVTTAYAADQHFIKLRVERIADPHDLALSHDERARDSLLSGSLHPLFARGLFLVVDGDGIRHRGSLAIDEWAHGSHGLIGDSDDRETLRLVLRGKFIEMRNRPHAWSTPGSPELHDDRCLGVAEVWRFAMHHLNREIRST